MKSKYHPEWQNNRIQFIINLYSPEFFKDKTILELGSFNGYIGNYFLEALGSKVTAIEGRPGNISNIKRDFPNLEVELLDLDTAEWPFGGFDIIINFGLYYHLRNHHEKHLINCINNCKLMFFETVVYDSSEPELFFKKEAGPDQSLSGTAGIPSTSYVENIFKGEQVKFKKHCEAALNGAHGSHHYDWKDRNSKLAPVYPAGLCSNNKRTDHARRFWVVENENL